MRRGKKVAATVADAAALAMELIRVRNADSEDRQHPLYAKDPEGWLEALVRANAEAIDASLRDSPLYGQVPVFTGRDRGVVDLLGVDDDRAVRGDRVEGVGRSVFAISGARLLGCETGST